MLNIHKCDMSSAMRTYEGLYTALKASSIVAKWSTPSKKVHSGTMVVDNVEVYTQELIFLHFLLILI